MRAHVQGILSGVNVASFACQISTIFTQYNITSNFRSRSCNLESESKVHSMGALGPKVLGSHGSY